MSFFSIHEPRVSLRALTILSAGIMILIAPQCLAAPAAAESATGSAKPLFGAFGGTGLGPEIAVVVVEINSPSEIKNVTVSDFALFDQAGKATKLGGVALAEVFNKQPIATEGIVAYYLNPDGTSPWDGTLPAGKIRLRIQVALAFSKEPVVPIRFKLTIGRYVIEGPVNYGPWASA
jgi:hypothetical protein